MLRSQRLCDITFYVDNQQNRPVTVDIDNLRLNLPIKRRCTPLVSSRQIRRKFLSNRETIDVGEIMTQRKQIQNKENKQNNRNIIIKSCQLRKGYRKQSLQIQRCSQRLQQQVQQNRHIKIFAKQQQHYRRMIKKYSMPKGDGDKKNMRRDIENFINYYG